MDIVDSQTIIHADDLRVGDVFPLGSWTFSREEIVAFGRLWDPLAFHVDSEAAARTRFGELIASGIHVVAVMHRLTADALYSKSSLVAGRGIQKAKLTSPVRAGTTLHGDIGVEDVRLRARQDALITLRGTLRNPEGDTVFEMIEESIWQTRPTETIDRV